MARRLPLRSWRTIAGLTSYVVVVAAGLTWLLRTGTDRAAVVVLAGAAVLVLVALLARTIGRTAATVRRIVGDTAVILDANPSHRIDAVGTGDLRPLVHAVNRLAERHESTIRGAAEQAEASRRDMESERNRFAALMAQLTVAVVVCNSEGRILLYNDAARSLLGEATPLGLGRSVFGVVDRGLVAHAEQRLVAGTDSVYTATTLHGEKLLRVRVTLVRDPAAATQAGSGFVLVLEDLTREVHAGGRRERVTRSLTEATRASLGSIRAAAESVLEFPDLSESERHRFLEIVRDEADRLGRRVEELTAEQAEPGEDRALTEMAGDDLLGLLASELDRAGLGRPVTEATEPLWLRVDGHALARCLVHLASRLAVGPTAAPALVLVRAHRHAQLDLVWHGSAPAASTVRAWLEEPVAGSGSPTGHAVVERHGGEVWPGDLDAGRAYLRALLPLPTEVVAGGEDVEVATVESRPEFYDFDLFSTGTQPTELLDRRLDRLSFTVFDTETTGLEPTRGDRVISIGAVRVVNGRVLRDESFERLVDPRRPVPAASTAIHGITSDMLEGAPPIDDVLPAFVRFAEETVLVGHNVGFDLQFLKLADVAADPLLAQPALDTLLLHAAVDPEHEEHTLEGIASRLGISVVGRHTALGDALVTAEVFVALGALLRQRGVVTLREALALSQTTYEARVDRRLYGS